MDETTNKNISRYIASMAEKYPRLIKAYLFGSYARKIDRPESDIDIALVIENLQDGEIFDFQVQFILLASEFDTRIEPHPVSSNDLFTGNPFIIEIKKTGIEIEPKAPDGWYRQ